jgi:hypothetical protein
MVWYTLPAAPFEAPRVTFRPLVAQGGGTATAGDSVETGAVAGAVVLLPGPAGLNVLGGIADVDGELDDDEEQPATEARTISAAAVPRIPLRECPTLGNTPVPPISWRHMRRPAKYDCRAGTPVGAGP